MTNPPEEVTVPRQVALDAHAAVYLVWLRGFEIGPRVLAALEALSLVCEQQGEEAPMWKLPAEVAWLFAYGADVAAGVAWLRAHGVSVRTGDTVRDGVIAQSTLAAAVQWDAPHTCSSMAKQRELGEV